MKFLCVPCDRPMKLQSVAPPDRGSLSVVYSCPDCGYEIAMLTNPYETQLVQSLGVKVSPAEDAARASTAGRAASGGSGGATPGVDAGDHQEAPAASSGGGKCPFAAMIPGMQAFSGETAQGAPSAGHAGFGEDVPVRWTSAAEERLANIPTFVRPMARAGIEKFARERGCAEIDEKILDAARDFFGM